MIHTLLVCRGTLLRMYVDYIRKHVSLAKTGPPLLQARFSVFEP